MAYTTIDKPDEYFNTKLYTGTGATNSLTGVGFQPDFTWIKERNGVEHHYLFDVVRGVTKFIYTNLTNGEASNANSLTAFDSDGFSLGNYADVNESGKTYASWNWKAGGTAVSNTVGDITSSVSANTTAEFSIVSYTGTGAVGTIGHGLGQLPAMIIFKNRSSATDWMVFHKNSQSSYSFSATAFLTLNLTSAVNGTGVGGVMNDTAPTTSLFTVGNDSRSNGSGNSMIAYCFAEVKGFSKFGSYTGNGNTDGPFVYTGFKPAFVMIKNASAGSTDWYLYDNKRGGPASGVYGNNNKFFLKPNSDAAEGNESFDMYSNGFKIKISNSFLNGSGNTLIYMAFAEQPFVTSTTNGSIPATAR
jgi:hypothetical protein